MKTLITFIMLFIAAVATAQLQVSINYGVPIQGDYGMAYMSVGDRLGGRIGIGADSRISYAGESKGAGYLSAGLYYDVVDDRNGWSLRTYAGIGSREEYRSVNIAPINANPHYQAALVSTKESIEMGIGVSWKFIELLYTSNNEIAFGVKLTRL